jgi:hypothetical protein
VSAGEVTTAGLEGANGNELTVDEVKAIRSLHRLAKRWPQTLKLVSMGGSLYVIHTADERFNDPFALVRGEAILDTIFGIPNDGGDW